MAISALELIGSRKATAQPRSPERARLAKAIERHWAALGRYYEIETELTGTPEGTRRCEALGRKRAAACEQVALLKTSVAARVRDVVVSDNDTVALILYYGAMHRELVNARRALDYLDALGLLPKLKRPWREEQDWPELAGAAAWERAVAALHEDPDAKLPSLEELQQ